MVAQNLDSVRNASAEDNDSGRWIAPEILEDRGTYSKGADVFSFAMVMIEVRYKQPARVMSGGISFIRTKGFTGAVPFSGKTPREAMLAIVSGERPPRPTHPTLTDEIWGLTQLCWDQEALLRPQVLHILRGL